MSIKNRVLLFVGTVMGLVGASLIAFSGTASAAEGEFYLQVSPSPLVATVKPGQTVSYDLKIRNAGSQVEKLKIAPRTFTIDNLGEVAFDDTKKPVEIGDWTTFSNPTFTVQPGESFTQKVTLAIPKDAGFSYSFALVINRQDESLQHKSGRELKGSVAIFALINIDKPGATRTLQLGELSTDHQVYEYLPAKINVQLKNVGNSIVRPGGNVFIQRTGTDSKPLTTLPVNKNEGYILPGSVRTLSIDWEDGFPGVHTNTDESGQPHVDTDWDFANLSKLRIGYYTAKLVAIYNDGQRDVPVTGEVGFWVIPWKLLLGVLLVIGLIGAGVWSIVGKMVGGTRSKGRSAPVKFRK
jgi:hypothetical protein